MFSKDSSLLLQILRFSRVLCPQIVGFFLFLFLAFIICHSNRIDKEYYDTIKTGDYEILEIRYTGNTVLLFTAQKLMKKTNYVRP